MENLGLKSSISVRVIALIFSVLWAANVIIKMSQIAFYSAGWTQLEVVSYFADEALSCLPILCCYYLGSLMKKLENMDRMITINYMNMQDKPSIYTNNTQPASGNMIQTSIENAPQTWNCNCCGYKNRSSVIYCENCGNKRAGK